MSRLDIALKEWKIIVDLMLEGEQALLLRKGGIDERGGPGRFEPEYRRLLLWPSWEHQKPEMIRPPYRNRVQVLPEPETVIIRGLAEVAGIWRVQDRERFDQLHDLHAWSDAQIDMRFGYKPERPLFLLLVRARRLSDVAEVVNRPEYAGCRSWVPLTPEDAVVDPATEPALSDAAFDATFERVTASLGPAEG